MRLRGRLRAPVIGLRAATLMVTAVLVVTLIAVLWFALRATIRHNFQAIEIVHAESRATAAGEVIESRARVVQGRAADWGVWTDTWDFMQSHAQGAPLPEYREENLTAGSLSNAGIDAVVYLDTARRPVEVACADELGAQLVEPDEAFLQYDWSTLATATANDKDVGAVALIGARAAFVGASPILKAGREGPRAGTIIMVRWMSGAEVARLAEEIGLPLTIRPATDADESRGQWTEVIDEKIIAAHFVATDALGRAAIVATLDVPRKVTAHAHETARTSLLALAFFGLLLTLAMYGATHILVVSRLVRLSRDLRHIAGCDGGSSHIVVDRHDEIGSVIASVNQLVTRIRDASDRTQEALHEQTIVSDANRKLAMVAARTDNAVVITDAAGVIEWVNLAFVRLTGFGADDAIGRRPGDLLQGPATDPSTRERIRAAIREQRHIDAEILNYRKDATPYWVRLSIEPVFDDDGRVQNYIAIESDVTARKAEERELIEARRVAEEAAAARATFVANISHEIRTPLNAILGFTELLRGAPADAGVRESSASLPCDDAERAEWLSIVHSSATHLLALINDVLDFSKLEADRMTVEPMPTDARAVVAQAARMHEVRAVEKAIALRLNIAPDVPDRVVTDPTRLRQIVANLVGNAVKFTDAGAVDVALYWQQAPHGAASLALEVRDTGIGISPAKMRELFTPFVQGDASITRRFGGTGLGLAICKGITEAMGGTIDVVSEVGAGTTIRVQIPASPADSCIPGAPCPDGARDQDVEGVRLDATANNPAPLDPAILAGARVLVADDAPANRRLFEIVLREAGATVRLVEHGEAAVQAALNEPFDIILMDGQMPVMDGITATSILRSRGVQIPIVALTAHTTEGDAAKFLDAGCDAHLCKPIAPSSLVRAVAGHLGRDARTARAAPTPDASTRDATAAAQAQIHAPDATPPTILDDEIASDPELRAIVEDFLSTVPARIRELRDSLNAEQRDAHSSPTHTHSLPHAPSQPARLAHALKGTAATLGAHAIAHLAAQVERAALRGDLDLARSLIDDYSRDHANAHGPAQGDDPARSAA